MLKINKSAKFTQPTLLLIMSAVHTVSKEQKCPYMNKLKGEGNFPLYFDNDDITYI